MASGPAQTSFFAEPTTGTAEAAEAPSPAPLSAELEAALHSFNSSPTRFRVVRSVNDGGRASPPAQTLYILDSSFNAALTHHAHSPKSLNCDISTLQYFTLPPHAL